jgi:PAS domain S-box-containing protein
MEQAVDGIFLADFHGTYTDVNSAGCRMLGMAREEIIGRTIMDLLPPEDIVRLAESKEVLMTGKIHVAEWSLRRKDGVYLPVEVSAKIFPDGRWQGFVRDISQRKEMGLYPDFPTTVFDLSQYSRAFGCPQNVRNSAGILPWISTSPAIR